MKKIGVVKDGCEVKEAIEQFLSLGFRKDNIYLLAHEKDRTEELTSALNINDIVVSELRDNNRMANPFHFYKDELHSKLYSLRLSDEEIQQYLKELNWGRILVIAIKTDDFTTNE
ncbi:general stress protein [Priestia aryabhattai]|uniref:general stress protein n=1 Tax=Priestia aryabhattai TaxID=412384 RepID=UPI001C0BAED8|nr:general stress protein [Priestia aryabhattai]MBU3570066.1 general stress protein [Priestia aryabhattai]WDL87861.1 general stress protein [Priestia aryabhattai]